MLRLFIFTVACLFLNPALACDGPFKDEKLSRNKVVELLNDDESNLCGAQLDRVDLSRLNLSGVDFSHASMVGTVLNDSDLSRANLNSAQLRHAELKKSYFRWAVMNHANLSEANITGANFIDAQLNHALFTRATLSNSDFSNATLEHAQLLLVRGQHVVFDRATMQNTNFSLARLTQSSFENAQADHAIFHEAHLNNANFKYAHLKHANFKNSHLNQSDFTQARLDKVSFENADMMNVRYMPSIEGVPLLNALAASHHFSTVEFYDAGIQAAAMSNLQTAYANAGIRPMERLITSMRKTAEMNADFEAGGLRQIEGLLNYLFFYVTCDFGLAPERPIFIVFILIILLTLPYYLSFGAHSPHAGIVVTWPSRRDPNILFEASYQHFVKIHVEDAWVIRLIKRQRRCMTAFYFSFLSSVRLGWQDFNLATWVTLIQTKEYHFIAKGWVRSLAGIQSIVSAYMLVLWALTYFGNPFTW